MNEDWIRSVQYPPVTSSFENQVGEDCTVISIDSQLTHPASAPHPLPGPHFRPLSHVLNVSDTVPNYFARRGEVGVAHAEMSADQCQEPSPTDPDAIQDDADYSYDDQDDIEGDDTDAIAAEAVVAEMLAGGSGSDSAPNSHNHDDGMNLDPVVVVDAMDVDQIATAEAKASSSANRTRNAVLPLKPLVYFRVSVADSHDENISQHFEAAVSFMAGAISSGGSVLVHCREGRSRSVTVIIAYLMMEKKWRLDQAYERMEAVAPDVNINSGFKRQLMELEMALHQQTSLDFFDKSDRAERINYNEAKLAAPTKQIPPPTVDSKAPHKASQQQQQQQQQQKQEQQLDALTVPPESGTVPANPPAVMGTELEASQIAGMEEVKTSQRVEDQSRKEPPVPDETGDQMALDQLATEKPLPAVQQDVPAKKNSSKIAASPSKLKPAGSKKKSAPQVPGQGSLLSFFQKS
jgi:hypothetical protein